MSKETRRLAHSYPPRWDLVDPPVRCRVRGYPFGKVDEITATTVIERGTEFETVTGYDRRGIYWTIPGDNIEWGTCRRVRR